MALSASSSLVSSTRSTLWLILGRVLTLHSYLHTLTVTLVTVTVTSTHLPSSPRPVLLMISVQSSALIWGLAVKYYFSILKHGT